MELINKNKSFFPSSSGFTVYLKREIMKLFGITPEEYRKIKNTNPEKINDFKLNTYFDFDRIILTPYDKIAALRPPGIDPELWRSFVSAMVKKYGYEDLDKHIIKEYERFIKDKIYLAVVNIFGNERWLWKVGDPNKLPPELVNRLPETIRNFLFTEASNKNSERFDNDSSDAGSDSSADK